MLPKPTKKASSKNSKPRGAESDIQSENALLPKAQFLIKHSISNADFNRTGLIWSDLIAIFNDYLSIMGRLDHSARAIVNVLFSAEARNIGVHSVRYRIKSPDSMIEKIILKMIKQPSRKITLENYTEEITDLIGIRALHVFKNDIMLIHVYITQTFLLKEGHEPIQYYRDGDDPKFIELCGGIGCKQQKHPRNYRSFHYIVSTQLTVQKHCAEIQVRTIFEEGWSEIDHRIRYTYKSAAVSDLEDELRQLGGLAGQADEAGSLIRKREQIDQQNRMSIQTQKKKK